MKNQRYDLVIIGAGPAGLVACLYALRFGLKVLLIEKMQLGGNLSYIEKLDNFPGFASGISGIKLAQNLKKQIDNFKFNFLTEEIKAIQPEDRSFWKAFSENNEFITKTLIVATGSSPKPLGIKGEEAFKGKGVSYCAVCDAPFFKNQDVIVVGGGNSALEEAIYLAKFAKTVTLIHRRDAFRADKVLQEKAKHNNKINFLMNTQCQEIIGKEVVTAIKIKNAQDEIEELACAGIFIFAGTSPNTQFLKTLPNKDDSGYIITNENLQTSAAGIFACGDCRKRPLPQVVTACAEGAIAAYSAFKYLETSFKRN